ncbi:mediator of RNA polymerase II transcription subunit 10-like [Clavelina lepadiformis]|uniref:Mediator of RNA polymerase II transcription subunit 10 n=1 Tax=Clavelina lepadiformis TaxID=159417 RepID=A0ABP0FIY4_CLALP
MADKFEVLEENLEQFIETVRRLGIIVSDFPPQGQNVLNQKVNSMITTLKEIENCKSAFADVQIPLEVFDYIDAGKNPQLYTKDCIEKALMKNELVKGKTDVYRKFRKELMSQLTTIFPEQISEYKKIREES